MAHHRTTLRSTDEYPQTGHIRDVGVAWKAPDGSAVFLPWSVLTGVRETGRLFLLLDQGGSHVRGFIPKAALAGLPPEAGIGRIRDGSGSADQRGLRQSSE